MEEGLAILTGEPLQIRLAGDVDVERVAGIIEDAAAWLASRGIDQWRMGDWLRPLIAERIAHGESYLAWLGDEAVATLALQWSDGEAWGPMPDDAGYVHNFAVRRPYGGRGIGRVMLRWAERTIAAAGKAYLRLDCMASNAALRAYYERAGFVERSDIPHDEWSTLYEKRVGET
jgi:ribosomal protein S18 acetylase RimI-like enzyme